MSRSTNRRHGRQLSLALLRGRGGSGRDQGRTRRRFDYVPHRARAYLDPNHPVHVSMSIVVGLPSLRGAKLWAAVRRGFLHGCVYGEARERKEQPATSNRQRAVRHVAMAATERQPVWTSTAATAARSHKRC